MQFTIYRFELRKLTKIDVCVTKFQIFFFNTCIFSTFACQHFSLSFLGMCFYWLSFIIMPGMKQDVTSRQKGIELKHKLYTRPICT